MSPVTNREENKIRDQQQQREAAAADLFAPLENQEAFQALRALDLSEQLAKRYADKDAALAIVVAAWCAGQFRAKRREPIESKPAFLIGALNDPLAYGFTGGEGGRWTPPAGPEAGPSVADRLSQTVEQALARRRQDEEDRKAAADAESLAKLRLAMKGGAR